MRGIFLMVLTTIQMGLCQSCDSLPLSQVLGTWWMTKIVTATGGEGPWDAEILCPHVLKLECRSDSLLVRYMDRYERLGVYHSAISNGGNDVILMDTSRTIYPTSTAGLFSIKIFGDTLWGITFERTHLYQLFWRRVSLDFPFTKNQIDSLDGINGAEFKARYLKAQKAKRKKRTK